MFNNNNLKISLNKLIYKNFFSTTFIFTPFIILTLTVIYFTAISKFSKTTQNSLIELEINRNKKVIMTEAEIINCQLEEIQHFALSLQKTHELFYSHLDKLYQNFSTETSLDDILKNSEIFRYFIPNDFPKFEFHKNSALYKKNNNNGSSLYFSGNTEFDTKKYIKMVASESLDPIYKSIVDNNPMISQIYLNTWDNMNRLYPFISNTPEQYGSTFNVTNYNFYYEADLEHNPEKGSVWTDAYLDPAGQGWLTSCIIPIYHNNFLEGVVGIDITIDSLLSNMFDDLSIYNNAFILDKDGSILVMTPNVEKIFDLKELKSHSYISHVENTVLKPTKYNIIENPNSTLKLTIKHMFEKNILLDKAVVDDTTFSLKQISIPQTKWKLFFLTNENSLLKSIQIQKKQIDDVSYRILGFIILLYIIFLLHMFKKLKILSQRISMPLKMLSTQTKQLNTNFSKVDLVNSNIKEISQLNQNFFDMTKELEKRTQELIKVELEKKKKTEEAELFYTNSITDSLTGLNNRLKIDEILEYEINQSERYNVALSLVFLDIDNFKSINDTFGHDMGDRILIELSEILKSSLRGSDTVGRWGGEEFIIICTNTELKKTALLAEKLRAYIENFTFSTKQTQTASFGIAEFEKGDSRRSLIQKADSALYEAKRSSKNIVMIYYDNSSKE